MARLERKPRDVVAAYADTRALGRIERRVQLGGKLPLPDGRSARPTLCLTTRGLWLIAADDALRGTAIDLLARRDLGVKFGRVRGQLEVGEQRLEILPHRRQDLLSTLAIGRVRAHGGAAPARVLPGRHLESPDEVERTWLAGFLERGEVLLAWLRSATMVGLPSTMLSDSRGHLSFVLTESRATLVAISEVGDTLTLPIDLDALEVLDSGAELTLASTDWQLTSLSRNAPLFREALQCAALAPGERLLQVARLNFKHRKSNSLEICHELLVASIKRGNGAARAAAFMVAEALDDAQLPRPDLGPALDWLRSRAAPERALAELWIGWDLPASAALRLVQRLRQYGADTEPWALALHRAVHARRKMRAPPAAAAEADLELAEHLIATDRRAEAAEMLEARLGAMPAEAAMALLAPSLGESSAGQEDRRLRSQAYQLLAEARADAQGPELGALRRLARLHPLTAPHVQVLAARAAGELRERAEQVLELLEPGALVRGRPIQPPRLGPLSETLLREVMVHPLTRADGPLLGKFQTLLALVPVPDYSVLHDYCERLAPNRKSPALDALRFASQVLGAGEVQAFVSRGLKGVGLRAFEASPPFILIGGQHLDPDTPYYLTPAELRFAVGAEVAHLRFGHHRVTANEVWAGAMSKGKEGLGLALGMLPVLKGWWVAERVAKATARVPMGTFRKVLDAAQELNERVGALQPAATEGTANRDDISALNEEFILAHRVMQLSADRAGLLLAGDLHSAARAMLLVRRDFRDALETVERDGLARMLGQRADNGHLAYLDLAIRVAALISFYLSDDYTQLANSQPNGR